MQAAEPPAEPTPPASPAAEDAYYQIVLREMSDLGMQLLRDVSANQSLDLAEKAEAFDRIARAVRRAIILARHIAANPANRAPEPAPRRPRPTGDAEAALANRTEPPDRAETERAEHVERPETVGDLTRSIPEIIAEILQDLRPPQPRRTEGHPPRPDRSPPPTAAHPRAAHPPYRGPPQTG